LRLRTTFSKTLLSNDSLKLVPRRLSLAWPPELSKRSTKLKTILSLTRAILCHAKHGKEIYYQFEDELVTAEAESVPEATTAGASTAIPAASVPVASPAPSGPAASIEDVPIRASDVLDVIVAQKLKKVEEVPLSKSIKDLVGGKSTLQNEILGDLQMEFASAPEKGEELPLEELGSALGVGYSGALGKYTSGLVSRMVGGKMPGGFNITSIKAHLSKTWGLGPSRSDGVLLLGTTMEPAKRLGSEVDAKAWLDTVVTAYAQRSGISLSAGGSGGGGSGGAQGATINSEEFLKFQAEQEFAAQHVELYMRYLKRDSRSGDIAFDKEKLIPRSFKLSWSWIVLQRNMGTPTSRGFSPSSTHSKPVASTHLGTGSVKTHSSCTMTWSPDDCRS
jgi:fatty acid synthase subunit alpha